MTAAKDDALNRENDYLRQRNAQLQDDVAALTSEAARLRQMLERHASAARAGGLTDVRDGA